MTTEALPSNSEYESKLIATITATVSQKIPSRGHISINELEFQVKNVRYSARIRIINKMIIVLLSSGFMLVSLH
jgi:hypothetical protein